MSESLQPKEKVFSSYQVFIIVILSIIQFSVILDFMVLSPLGAILMPTLHITTSQFGLVVSAYAFSAGASGILAAGFADKFDRKKLLMFFYVGFIVGTALCAMASDYYFLLVARIITGIFGGVIGSIGLAIVTDLFKLEVRGRVMGFTQMAFAASQILGLPIGLLLANKFNWHAPFWMIVIFGSVVGVLIFIYMKPVNEHLRLQIDRKPVHHLIQTITYPDYLKAFFCTALLATGGFMLMPFGAAFGTNNLGLTLDQLPLLYGVSGVFSIFTGPLIGKLSDQMGKMNIFIAGTLLSALMVGIYTRFDVTPFWVVVAINVVMFTGITARMISSTALVSAIPNPTDRGAFMSINSSIQQISGGIASAVAGLIVFQNESGKLMRYEQLGYVVIVTMLITIVLMGWIDRHVKAKTTQVAQSV
jgi:predicted MFS family arabinose efflux permease